MGLRSAQALARLSGRGLSGGFEKAGVVRPNLVVGIGVHPTNGPGRVHEEDARYRKLMVALARCLFEIDPVLLVLGDFGFTQLEDDSEGTRGSE